MFLMGCGSSNSEKGEKKKIQKSLECEPEPIYERAGHHSLNFVAKKKSTFSKQQTNFGFSPSEAFTGVWVPLRSGDVFSTTSSLLLLS